MENFIIYILYFLFFYFGAIMGSFLNVVALEYGKLMTKNNLLEKKDSLIEDDEKDFLNLRYYWREFIYIFKKINRRSSCPSCGHKLSGINLFPVFSYLWNLGKCRYCGAKISPRYLMVEIFSGIVFLLLFIKLFNFDINYNFFIDYLSYSIIFSVLILIFLLDFVYKEVPLLPYYFALIFSFIFLAIKSNLNWNLLWHSFLVALPFYLIYKLTTPKSETGEELAGGWMGSFDWKLIFLLNLFLVGFGKEYSFIVLSFWYGAIYSLFLMYMSKKYDWKSEVPFGPFIILAFWTVFFFNTDILKITAKIMNLFS